MPRTSGAVRWRGEGAVPEGGASRRRAVARGDRRAPERARWLGDRPAAPSTARPPAKRGCSSRSPERWRLAAYSSSCSARSDSSLRSARSPSPSVAASACRHGDYPRHLAGGLVGVVVQQQLCFDVRVERWLVADLPPRRHDDQHQAGSPRSPRRSRGPWSESTRASGGCMPSIIARARCCADKFLARALHPRPGRTSWWIVNRKLLIRRIVSIVALTVSVTILAAIGSVGQRVQRVPGSGHRCAVPVGAERPGCGRRRV